jgi:hypothetical protein
MLNEAPAGVDDNVEIDGASISEVTFSPFNIL